MDPLPRLPIKNTSLSQRCSALEKPDQAPIRAREIAMQKNSSDGKTRHSWAKLLAKELAIQDLGVKQFDQLYKWNHVKSGQECLPDQRSK